MALSLFGTCVVALILLLSIFYLLCRDDGKGKTIKKQPKTPNEPIEFSLKNLELPVLAGWPLYFASCIFKWRLTAFLKEILCREASKQADAFRQTSIPDPPTFLPLVPPTKKQQDHKPSDLEAILKKRSVQNKGFSFVTIPDLVNAYRNGETTPLQVTENVLEAIQMSEKSEPKLRAFVEFNRADALLMAQESTKRYNEKKPLSIIDGIPVGIKDEIGVAGYHKRCGTVFLGSEPEEKDCNLVAKLRELGAVIMGMTNMHEIGLGTTGNNPSNLHGTARNPYNLDYHTGGSSSGSACAVAAGLCPVAIGKDGGGSIRIPASLCGVVGVKGTFGRITAHSFKSSGGTVSHVGPICNNVRDTAIMYALLSGRDVDYSPGLTQPEHVTLDGFENLDLSDLTVGVDWSFAEFSDKEVVDHFKTAVDYIKQQGATVTSIQIPELEESRVAHSIIIASEILTTMKNECPDQIAELSPANVILCGVFGRFSAVDYIVGLKQRTRAIEFMKPIFNKVDCILTPATGSKAPKISEASLEYGVVDGHTTGALMRYSTLGNLTGIPGVVVPVGYDGNHLPVGVQVMTSWWEEHVAFRVAHCLEGLITRRRPVLHYNIMNPARNN